MKIYHTGRLTKAHPEDTGYDLYAQTDAILEQFQPVKIPTGVSVEVVPDGRVVMDSFVPDFDEGKTHAPDIDIQLRPRSSMSAKGILSHLGTIDQPYRGEIMVTLQNLMPTPYEVKVGDKIAQLVFAGCDSYYLIPTTTINENSSRGTNGFGSSGR